MIGTTDSARSMFGLNKVNQVDYIGLARSHSRLVQGGGLAMNSR